MCFSKSDASVDKQRIVHFSRRFGHCQGCGVGKVVVVADDEGIEGILRIQVGVFDMCTRCQHC